MINPMNLSGKTILITGASSGIGKATAILISKLGARVVMVARNEDKLKQVMDLMKGQGHTYYTCDLKEIDGIELFIKKIIDENGKLSGFVHCAGISVMRPLSMTNFEFLHDIMLINFYSFIEVSRCISKKGFFDEGMSIVGMSSIASTCGDKSQVGYSSSKAALDASIRVMAKELAVKEIRINSIQAGLIKTEMFNGFLKNLGIDENDSRFDNYYLGLGVPNDVANSIAFLLSDSSRIITGTSIVVDSGLTS